MYQGQGPVEIMSSQSHWSSSILQDAVRKPIHAGKVPSHIKPTSSEPSGKIIIGNRVDVVTCSSSDSLSTSSEENFLPSRFNHEMEEEYESRIETDYVFNTRKLEEDPENGNLRVKVAFAALLISEMYAYYLAETQAEDEVDHEDEELYLRKQNSFLDLAKNDCKNAKDINPLDPLAYYTESMIMEFQGVDCQDIEKVTEYLKLLKLAMALDPSKTDIKITWDNAIAFLKKRWLELKNDEEISADTYNVWIKHVTLVVSSNPLIDLFQNDPKLFALSRDAKHTAFFKRNPELKTIEAFLTKYPNAGFLPLDSLSVAAIRAAVEKGQANPLATKLFFVHPRGNKSLNEEQAEEIKAAMIKYAERNKTLKVYFGNQEDVDLLVRRFKVDKSLPQKYDTLTNEIIEWAGISIPIYALYL